MDDRAALKKLRPWYFVLAMCLTWVAGVFTAVNSCGTFSYLRGEQQVVDQLRKDEERIQTPADKLSVELRKAYLHDLGEQHRTAFPLSIAKLLLAVLLTLVSGAALAGRKNARTLSLQAVVAYLALAAVAFVLEAPIREGMVQTVQQRPAGFFGAMPPMTDAQSQALYATMVEVVPWVSFLVFQLGLSLFALFALTRPRTREFFAAVADAQRTSEQL